MFWLVFGLCWKVLERGRGSTRHFGMPAQLTSHWRRARLYISLALLPRCTFGLWWRVVAAESDG
ncbi:hypothetical protein KCP69_22500 [Salmonella enterica subsp. enterica]|nr:hypothetical protein KCP69_22500 [Salmonella enterica subsp. enterica]